MVWDSGGTTVKHSVCPGGGICPKAYHEKGIEHWGGFWDAVDDYSRKENCFVLELGGNGRSGSEKAVLKRVVRVPALSVRSVQIRAEEGFRADIDLEIVLERGSHFGLCVRAVLANNSDLSINVVSLQDGPGSHFLDLGRIGCRDGSVFECNTHGALGSGADGSSCLYDTQVLQLGNGGMVKGKPEMDIGAKNVQADHGFSVGVVPGEVRVYMESRGLDRAACEEVYLSGFLKSGIV